MAASDPQEPGETETITGCQLMANRSDDPKPKGSKMYRKIQFSLAVLIALSVSNCGQEEPEVSSITQGLTRSIVQKECGSIFRTSSWQIRVVADVAVDRDGGRTWYEFAVNPRVELTGFTIVARVRDSSTSATVLDAGQTLLVSGGGTLYYEIPSAWGGIEVGSAPFSCYKTFKASCENGCGGSGGGSW